MVVTRPSPATRSAFTVWRRFSTRWSDNDVYAHVNNTVFYEWFDSAVNSWMIEEGLLDVADGDPIALVVGTSCSYFKSLAFPEEVDVGLVVAALGTTSIRYQVGIFRRDDGEAAAQGEFVHVVVDRQSRTPTPIPAEWRTRLEAIS